MPCGLEAVGRLTRFAADRGVGAVVVSLGVDAARDDPESPLQVTVDGYAAAGRQRGRDSASPPSSSRKVGTTWTALASWCWLRCSPSRGRSGMRR